MDERKYNMYKGLQKPIVFKGFVGRYIYWGVGIILGAITMGILCFILFNKIIGFLVMGIIISIGLSYTSSKQKRGLYSKKEENKVVFIVPNNIKLNRSK